MLQYEHVVTARIDSNDVCSRGPDHPTTFQTDTGCCNLWRELLAALCSEEHPTQLAVIGPQRHTILLGPTAPNTRCSFVRRSKECRDDYVHDRVASQTETYVVKRLTCRAYCRRKPAVDGLGLNTFLFWGQQYCEWGPTISPLGATLLCSSKVRPDRPCWCSRCRRNEPAAAVGVHVTDARVAMVPYAVLPDENVSAARIGIHDDGGRGPDHDNNTFWADAGSCNMWRGIASIVVRGLMR